MNSSSANINFTKFTPKKIREEIRQKRYLEDTSGLGGGYTQGNLVVLPSDYAEDFLKFCELNPKPCPLIGVSEIGNPIISTLGSNVNVCIDVSSYKVFENGIFKKYCNDITDLWCDDFVAFVLGCSFSFEEALISEGIKLQHIERKKTVPMYRTNIPCVESGAFKGNMIVSMRPLSVANTIRAIEITSKFPNAHGSPIHFGNHSEIGIEDINTPDFGDKGLIRDGEIPVFWACGVTSQVIIENVKPHICITHRPGHMLVTDLPSEKTSSVFDKKKQ